MFEVDFSYTNLSPWLSAAKSGSLFVRGRHLGTGQFRVLNCNIRRKEIASIILCGMSESDDYTSVVAYVDPTDPYTPSGVFVRLKGLSIEQQRSFSEIRIQLLAYVLSGGTVERYLVSDLAGLYPQVIRTEY